MLLLFLGILALYTAAALDDFVLVDEIPVGRLKKLKRTTKLLGMSIRRERLPRLRAKSTKTLRLIFASARFSKSSARCF